MENSYSFTKKLSLKNPGCSPTMKSAHPGINSAIMEKQKQDVDVTTPTNQL